MPSKKTIVRGCGIAALVCLAGVAAVVLSFAYIVQDGKGVGVSVNGPTDVVVGQTFELSVTVTNERPRKVLALSDALSRFCRMGLSTADSRSSFLQLGCGDARTREARPSR